MERQLSLRHGIAADHVGLASGLALVVKPAGSTAAVGKDGSRRSFPCQGMVSAALVFVSRQ